LARSIALGVDFGASAKHASGNLMQVTIVDQTGVVEDVCLNCAALRSSEGRGLPIRNERVGLEFICKTRSSVTAFALRPRSGSRPSAIPRSPVATLAGIRH
jgi:hypothetical protein